MKFLSAEFFTLIENLKWLWSVASIFYAVYSKLCSFVPKQNPSVHLQAQSLEYHVLLTSATEAVCGTHSLRIVRPIYVPGRTK